MIERPASRWEKETARSSRAHALLPTTMLLEALEPVLSQVIVTRTSSTRALDPDELGAIAVSIFGADRVVVVPRLVDALADGVALAGEYGPLAQSGVLVTGSVVTAGEARALLFRGG